MDSYMCCNCAGHNVRETIHHEITALKHLDVPDVMAQDALKQQQPLNLRANMLRE